MDKYIYLLLSCSFGVIWTIIFINRVDLRGRIWKTSIMGGLCGLVAEVWYFRDYWQPPTLLGHGVISIEDFLFGFFITGISASLYDFMARSKEKNKKPQEWKIFGIMFILGLSGLLFLNNMIGINSIIVTSGIFLLLTILMLSIRKDLLFPSLLSGFSMVFITIVIYHIIFNFIAPEYWNSYWLLANTKLGFTPIGNIPLTELIWYFSWGCFAGIEYDFTYGQVKIKFNK